MVCNLGLFLTSAPVEMPASTRVLGVFWSSTNSSSWKKSSTELNFRVTSSQPRNSFRSSLNCWRVVSLDLSLSLSEQESRLLSCFTKRTTNTTCLWHMPRPRQALESLAFLILPQWEALFQAILCELLLGALVLRSAKPGANEVVSTCFL